MDDTAPTPRSSSDVLHHAASNGVFGLVGIAATDEGQRVLNKTLEVTGAVANSVLTAVYGKDALSDLQTSASLILQGREVESAALAGYANIEAIAHMAVAPLRLIDTGLQKIGMIPEVVEQPSAPLKTPVPDWQKNWEKVRGPKA